MTSIFRGVKIMADVKPTDRYVVIGGQYKYTYYGSCQTLDAAKKLADDNHSYHDNFGGWYCPYVYHIEDVDFTSVAEYDPDDLYAYYARPFFGASALYGGAIDD